MLINKFKEAHDKIAANCDKIWCVKDHKIIISNEEDIFCLLHRFKNSLKPHEWARSSKGKVLLNEKDDELIIFDKAIGRIAKELLNGLKKI